MKTILVAEDNDDVRVMLRSFLEDMGYRVVEAVNGGEAVEVARRERPDLIMLDLNMPVLDGFEAAHLIRQTEGLRDVPIIANSAYGMRGIDLYLHIDELGEGKTDYIAKPISFDELRDRLERLCPVPRRD